MTSTAQTSVAVSAAGPAKKLLVLSDVNISKPLQHDATRPLPDYVVLRERFQPDILDTDNVRETTNLAVRLLRNKLGHRWAIALATLLRVKEYDAILAMGDDVAMELALLLKLTRTRVPLFVICQNMGTRRTRLFLNWLKLGSVIQRFLCISEAQARMVLERYAIEPEQIAQIHFHIDHRYFSPAPEQPVRRQICSAGLASRDYATFIEATRGLDVDVKIDASSAWYSLKTNLNEVAPHERVEVRHGKSTMELRQLYAESLFVVVPLLDVPYAAGYTVILEAMAMGKPVICTRTVQHGDFIEDGHNGFYVSPNNPEELRARISYLLEHPEEVARMGANARQTIEQRFTLDHFAQRIGGLLATDRP